MKTAIATLKSEAPYSQSRSYSHEIERLNAETADAYEKRTWRNKCHAWTDGKIYIPPMAFKMGLDAAFKSLGRQIPGKGKSTYTKYSVAGILCTVPIHLPMTSEDVACDMIYANSDGVRGSGKRVWRMFPRIDSWRADVEFSVLADQITKEIFEEHLAYAGAFVGIGRFRPEKGGFYGRFSVEKVKWH